MSITRMRVSALAAALLGLLAGAVPAAAQGTTTGAISGRVTETGGLPVANVQVQVRNEATGFSNGALTRDDGRYTVLGLEPGTYTVTARRIGFQAVEARGVRVTLSQTTPLDLTLSTQAAQLEAVTVTAETGTEAIISPSRTGASTTIGDTLLSRLPSLNRNFTDFVALTPQISSGGPGLSGGGTNNRYNNIQIDGATESDLFGLGSTGQPGGQAGGKSISIESVKEYQVLLSPYDVRLGNFSGALINAVTKSGTNEFTGSIYGFGRTEGLTRSQPYINEFEQAQYGFSLGGPIVRDRVLFFVNPEFQIRDQPAGGAYLGFPGSRATQGDIDRITAALESRGMTALGGGEQVTIANPLTNVFARLDFNFGNTQAVLRHNYGLAEDDNFSRGTSGTEPSFPLSGNGYSFRSVKNATVLQLRSNFANGAFNEFIAGYTTIRDKRAIPAAQPQVEVRVAGVANYSAGAERSSQANSLDQDILELTNNFTFPLGSSHRVTLGTQNQLYEPVNVFGQQRYGRWEFDSLDSLEAGLASRYSVGVPQANDGQVTFRALQLSAYVQDEWQTTDDLRITLGLRADMPRFLDEPPHNEAFASEFGGRSTSDVPNGNMTLSPRVGFNWDLTGDQRNQLRGGVGMFTGRPAFVWLSNAFQNSGLGGYAQLTCNPVRGASTANQGIPAFNAANVANAPQACPGGLTAAAGGEINLFDPDFEFPQNFRATLGYDRDLGDGLIWTLEGLYTRGINNIFYRNIALADQDGLGTGAHGRVVYGVRPNTPTRATGTNRNVVLEATNDGEEYSYSVTTGLTRRFRDNFAGSIFYTYGRAFDTQSLTSSTAFSQYRFGRTLGNAHSNTEATASRWDQPVRIVANGTYTFPTNTDLSLIWVGQSGGRYDYIYNQDLNGDGFSLNDLIYVPTDARNTAEMQFSPFTTRGVTYTAAQQAEAFNSFIAGTACLREARGRIMSRLACREPFTNRIDLSVRQSLPTFGGQALSVALDVINFGNLLNDNWGRVPLTSGTPVTLLTSSTTLVGGTLPEGGLPRFNFDPTQQKFNADRLSSNYQMQLSVRYSF